MKIRNLFRLAVTRDPVARNLIKLGCDFKRGKDGNFFVSGSIDLSGRNLAALPDLSSVEVEGSFKCSNNRLTSLSGAPRSVGGTFDCSHNLLVTLAGAPKSLGGYGMFGPNRAHFDCSYNRLTSLSGAPLNIPGDFNCSHNRLVSLEGASQDLQGTFDCSHNLLTSLQGGPKKSEGTMEGPYRLRLGWNYDCSHNLLTSLEGAPEQASGDFDCSKNRLTSLKGAPRSSTGFAIGDADHVFGGTLNYTGNPLASLEYAPREFVELKSDFGVFTEWKAIPEAVRGPAAPCTGEEAAGNSPFRSAISEADRSMAQLKLQVFAGNRPRIDAL